MKGVDLNTIDFVFSATYIAVGRAVELRVAKITISRTSENVMARLIHKFCNYTNNVNCVAFSPDCNMLISVSSDKTIVWNGLELQQSPVNGHSLSVVCCACSPNNSILATGSIDNLVMLWDVENVGKIATLQGHAGSVRCCSFSRNSKYLCSASSDETVRLWDMEIWKMRILEAPESSMQVCCFSQVDVYEFGMLVH